MQYKSIRIDPIIRKSLYDLDVNIKVYYVPTGFRNDIDGINTLSLAGSKIGFSAIELIIRNEKGGANSLVLSILELKLWSKHTKRQQEIYTLLSHLTSKRPEYCKLNMLKSHMMGIVNVTPDSFSDGGMYYCTEKAIEHSYNMINAGVSIIDVGGQSTRPGAQPISEHEELSRVIPVIKQLSKNDICVSIDTYHLNVMESALHAGAIIINDISGIIDKHCIEIVRKYNNASIILMHIQGTIKTMHTTKPNYDCAILDIYDSLNKRVKLCEKYGLPRSKICIDPGIGFSKSVSDNLEILSRLALFHGIGCPILLGASRKSFIQKIDNNNSIPKQRLGGSIACAINGLLHGVQIIRIHDYQETLQAFSVIKNIYRI